VKAGPEVCENSGLLSPLRARRETLNRNGTLRLLPPLLALGLAASAVMGCRREEPVVVAAPTTPPPAMPTGNMPPGAMPRGTVPGAVAENQHIAAAEQVLARDPKNVKAWIALGNDYFDSHQPQKSIDAYANALTLEPNNPDVLTDQGVMYREIGASDKALANFLKANQIAPRHFQSLFNAGVVYAYDLKDSKKAVETWNKIIAADPSGPFATQSRAAIQGLQQGGPGR
jgi:cytochrome c-type biogenesis protein CcmH/NrfG